MENFIGKFVQDRRKCDAICIVLKGYGVLLLFALLASADPILQKLGLA